MKINKKEPLGRGTSTLRDLKPGEVFSFIGDSDTYMVLNHPGSIAPRLGYVSLSTGGYILDSGCANGAVHRLKYNMTIEGYA